MKKNKIMAVLLAAVMMFTMLGATAWADDNVAQIGNTGYPSLKAAVKAANDGDTVKLISDIKLDPSDATYYAPTSTYYWFLPQNKFTLDLNGKTISLDDDALAATSNVNYWLFYLYGADITVTGDGTIDLSTTNDKISSSIFRLYKNQNSKLTINGGTFISSNAEIIYANYGNPNSVVINDGTFKFTTGDPARTFNCAGYSNFAFTIYGGTFEGFDPSNMEGGSMLATDYIVRSTSVNGIRVYTPAIAPKLNRFTAEADYTHHNATADMLSLTINNIGTYTEATKTTVELYLDDIRLTSSEATVAWSDTMSAVIVLCGSNDVSSSWNTTYVNTDAWTTTTIPNKAKITIGNYDPFWVNIDPSTTDLVVGGYTYADATDMFKGELAKFDMFENVVEIYSAADFQTFIESSDQYEGKTIKLINDIDMNGANLTCFTAFNGTFNGQNHTVSNFTINKPLLGNLRKNGTVQNVTFEQVTLNNTQSDLARLGIICSNVNGKLENVTIKDCTIQSENDKVGVVGGLAAMTQNGGIVKNCTVDGFTVNVPQGAVSIGGAFGIMIGDATTSIDGITVKNLAFMANNLSNTDESATPYGVLKGRAQGNDVTATNTNLCDFVASIGNTTGIFSTLGVGVLNAQPGDTVTLLKDTTEGGIIVGTAPTQKNSEGVTPFPESDKPLTIDLNGHTYTIGNPSVGSKGTETNGMQLLRDNYITIKNGTITSKEAKHLIQNYSNLTLDNVTLDGSQLSQAPSATTGKVQQNYTLSNGCGTVTITNGSKIIASPNGYAFDIYVHDAMNQFTDPKEYFYHSVDVTVVDSTIIGLVEFSGRSANDNRDDLTYTFTSKVNGTKDQEYSAGDIYEQITEANKEDGEIVGHFHLVSGAAYTLTFDLDGGSMQVNNLTYNDTYRELIAAGEKVDLTRYTPYKSGYSFAGWYLVADGKDTPTITSNDDGTGEIVPTEQPITSIEVGNETTIIAHWTKNSGGHSGKTYYTVTFNTNGGSKIANQTIRKNNTVEKPADPTRTGYKFAGWYADSSLKTKFDFATKITKTTTIYADWEKVTDTGKDDNNSGTTKTKTIILTLNSREAIVFGKTVMNDVPPLAVNNRVNMPTRFVAENLSCTVHWDKATGLITIKGTHFTTGEEMVITLTVGSNSATVNGKTVALDSTTFVQNNRIYTPLRFVAETLGATVDWNSTTKKITITIPE